MIRLQMLTLDMIDTVITDSAISLPKISSENLHLSTSDNFRPAASENFQSPQSISVSASTSSSNHCISSNHILLNHTNDIDHDQYNNLCVNPLNSNEKNKVTRNDNNNHNFNSPQKVQEIQNRGHDFSRIRTSDRLRLRNCSCTTKTLWIALICLTYFLCVVYNYKHLKFNCNFIIYIMLKC